ncbi:MAG TPA: Rossmann-like and DUF2520 domain-containing protein [Bacteroidales bacterium]
MQSQKKIEKISFIGSGNVAWGLAPFLRDLGVEIVEVYSTNPQTSSEFAKTFKCNVAGSLASLNKNSDLYLLAVPDKEIEKLAKAFPDVKGIVAHTSGIVAVDGLKNLEKYGVFYPLQTFTKGLTVEISKVPFCIEASGDEVEKELLNLASGMSENVQLIDSVQRKNLHLSAVLVSNFPNLLYHYASELLEEKGLNFQILIPLMEESVRKVKYLKPKDAQTGPAKRNDLVTIEEHLRMLEDFPQIKNIYNLISEQIRKKYHE